MSNHRIPADDKYLDVMIGWDPPLSTYFLHVVDTTKGEDEEGRDVEWVGCTPEEIYDLEVLDSLVKQYVRKGIPEDLWHAMYDEAD